MTSQLLEATRAVEEIRDEIIATHGPVMGAAFQNAADSAIGQFTCEARLAGDRAWVYVSYEKDPGNEIDSSHMGFLTLSPGKAGIFEICYIRDRDPRRLIAKITETDPDISDKTLRDLFGDQAATRRTHLAELNGAVFTTVARIFSGRRFRIYNPGLHFSQCVDQISVKKKLCGALIKDIEHLLDEVMDIVDPKYGRTLLETGSPDAYRWLHEGSGAKHKTLRHAALHAWNGTVDTLLGYSDGLHEHRAFPENFAREIDSGRDPLEVGAEALGVSREFFRDRMPAAAKTVAVCNSNRGFFAIVAPLFEHVPQAYWPKDESKCREWCTIIVETKSNFQSQTSCTLAHAEWADCLRRIDPEWFSPESIARNGSYGVINAIVEKIAKTGIYKDVAHHLLIPAIRIAMKEHGAKSLTIDRLDSAAYRLGSLLYRAVPVDIMDALEAKWQETGPALQIDEYQRWRLTESNSLIGDRTAIETYGYDPRDPEISAMVLELYRSCLPKQFRDVETIDDLLQQSGILARELKQAGIKLPDLPRSFRSGGHRQSL